MEMTRTVSAANVVVTQWVFTGTNSGPRESLAVKRRALRTGGSSYLCGMTVCSVSDSLIQRETVYTDFATLPAEPGIES